MKRIYVAGMALALLAGCASQAPSGAAAGGKLSVQQQTVAGPIQFLDTDQFDDQMASALGDERPDVKVDVLVPFSPNSIPDRAKKWLAAVTSSGGKVTVQADQRGIFLAALGMFPDVIAMVKQVTLYRKADGYDAMLIMKDGNVVQMVFHRRPEQ